MGGGGGVKGILEFFRKFIRFGSLTRPSLKNYNRDIIFLLLFIFNVSGIRSIPSIVSFPQLSNLGLFIRATVSESNCPVGRSPPKA